MASTYTDGLAIEIIGPGDKAGSWGSITSNNLKSLEEGVSRYAEIEVEASATSDLDITNGATAYSAGSIGRSAVIKWINTVTPGTGTHTVSLKVASSNSTQARFTAINNLPSARELVISCGIGSNVTIPNGYSAVIHIAVNDAGVVSGVANSLANLSVDTLISSGLITGNLQGNATSVTNGVYTGNNLSALSPGATATELRTRVTGTTGSGNLVFATAPTLANATLTNPALGTPSALIGTNISGTAASLTAGNATLAANATNATTAATVTTIPALTGAVTSSGSFNTATALANNAVSEVNIANDAVSEGKLQVSNSPTNGDILSAQSGGGGLQWIAPGTAGNVTSITQGTGGIVVTNPTSASPTISLGLPVSSATSAGTATSAGSITGITNINIVQLADTQTLTNKTLTSPDINTPDIDGGNIDGVAINSSTIGATSHSSGKFTSLEVTGILAHMNSTQSFLSFGLVSGESGLRYNGARLSIRNSAADAFGQAYHANMTSGQGAYAEISTAYTGTINQTIDFDVTSLGIASGDMPSIIELWMKRTNSSTDKGYAQNDWVSLTTTSVNFGSFSEGFTLSSNNTTVTMSAMGNAGTWLKGVDKLASASTKVYSNFATTGWTLVCKAWK